MTAPNAMFMETLAICNMVKAPTDTIKTALVKSMFRKGHNPEKDRKIEYDANDQLIGYYFIWSYGNLKYRLNMGIDIIKDAQGNITDRLPNATIISVVKL